MSGEAIRAANYFLETLREEGRIQTSRVINIEEDGTASIEFEPLPTPPKISVHVSVTKEGVAVLGCDPST